MQKQFVGQDEEEEEQASTPSNSQATLLDARTTGSAANARLLLRLDQKRTGILSNVDDLLSTVTQTHSKLMSVAEDLKEVLNESRQHAVSSEDALAKSRLATEAAIKERDSAMAAQKKMSSEALDAATLVLKLQGEVEVAKQDIARLDSLLDCTKNALTSQKAMNNKQLSQLEIQETTVVQLRDALKDASGQAQRSASLVKAKEAATDAAIQGRKDADRRARRDLAKANEKLKSLQAANQQLKDELAASIEVQHSLKTSLSEANESASRVSSCVKDAVPMFWDWVASNFRLKNESRVDQLLAAWVADDRDIFAEHMDTVAILWETASSPPRAAPFLNRVVGKDIRSWSVPTQPSGASETSPSLVNPVTMAQSTARAKRSFDGDISIKSKKSRPSSSDQVIPPEPNTLPPDVVLAYEALADQKPWERYQSQESFVPVAFRVDPVWASLHQALVEFWAVHARAVWNRWYLPCSSKSADNDVDALLSPMTSLAGCLYRVLKAHGPELMHFLSYPHAFWPVYLQQAITLKKLVLNRGEECVLEYLRSSAHKWWPDVPSVSKTKPWSSPPQATLSFLKTRVLKTHHLSKFDPSDPNAWTLQAVRNALQWMIDVADGFQASSHSKSQFPFVHGPNCQPAEGSQWAHGLTLPLGVPSSAQGSGDASTVSNPNNSPDSPQQQNHS
ncbi:hypothetical protein H257_18573 [Aphanomyces astaci]|uniref:Uncharacterized protein n=1 Tax=Aphanomyces astaci TaxID=112090 RepID=W4FCE7_APHAT|nr:hypothetical protein H257_18573 [Aphanomyces astaci]ETV64554.1 hypothetical protein H257_18573 [Aphanomyces astaci]RQM30423.1 hypothetical protein B5M09_013120 [Aphanomyces astaci]|eukprot:XP_009845968.1 hypothetical protein H257_18573 [Aphanomyces astaci]